MTKRNMRGPVCSVAFGRPIIIPWLLFLGCAVRTERGPGERHVSLVTPMRDAGVEHSQICTLPEEPAAEHRSTPRFTAVALDKWVNFAWFFSAESTDGLGILHRMFALAKAPEDWRLKAIGTFRPETGALSIETTAGHSTVRKIRLRAQLPEGRTSTLATLEETMLVPADPGPQEVTDEVVLLVDESGDFWSRLERMHRCSVEALAKVR